MSFLQSEFWADFKSGQGWKKYLFTEENGELKQTPSFEGTVAGKRICVMLRSFSLKIRTVSIAYVPMYPALSDFSENGYETEKKLAGYLESLSQKLKVFLPKNTMCIRFDPFIEYGTVEERDSFVKNFMSLKNTGTRKSSVNVQPPDTTILDLNKTEDQILADMKNKWRYNVRLASKKGVEIHSFDRASSDFDAMFDEFYRLFMITSERDGVQFHKKSYYTDLFKSDCSKENVRLTLYMAKHENDWLAGIITIFCGDEAVYLYGASGSIKRNLMSAYLLQWNAICDAKKFGCEKYDFYGMPPTDDENHPMHGLYLFKTGFGGRNAHRVGSFDAVLKKGDYGLYSLLEVLRAFWFKKIKKVLPRKKH